MAGAEPAAKRWRWASKTGSIFDLLGERRQCRRFERRLELAVDVMETVFDRIMTYRTPLAGMAFCADRNAR